MRKFRAVILCASAMSSGLIVEDMKKVAPGMDIDITVECFASLRYRSFDYSQVDIVLLAPQIKSQTKDIAGYTAEIGFDGLPIMLIPMREYGLIKGESILKQAVAMVDSNQR